MELRNEYKKPSISYFKLLVWGAIALASILIVPVFLYAYFTGNMGNTLASFEQIGRSVVSKKPIQLASSDPKAFIAHVNEPAPQRTPDRLVVFPLMAGDKLKISFLEKISLSTSDDESSGDPQLRSFFERTDLSGNFEIFNSGQISHPILGLFQVAGKQLHELEKELAQDGLNVRVTLVSRPPVYVKGFVGRPGAYKYVPGMTVSHAITLASGIYRGASRKNILDDSHRFKQYEQRLAIALAQQARLFAELAGNETVAVPDRLVQLVGKDDASIIFEREQNTFRRLKNMRSIRRNALKRAGELAERSISTVLEQQSVTQQQSVIIQAAVNKFRKNYGPAYLRASVKSQEKLALLDLKSLELASIEAKLTTTLIAARQKKVQIELDMSNLELSETTEIRTKLDSLEGDIIDYEANLLMTQNTLDQKAHDKSSPALTSLNAITGYEIRRSSNGRTVSMLADEYSAVGPGDIINVIRQ